MYGTLFFSKGKEILSTGSVISFNNEPITIKILENGKQIVSLQFVFQNNTDTKDATISTAVSNDTMVFTLTNFNNPLGVGTTNPIDFAKYKDRTMYLHFRVNSLSESDNTLYYTVYAEGGNGDE